MDEMALPASVEVRPSRRRDGKTSADIVFCRGFCYFCARRPGLSLTCQKSCLALAPAVEKGSSQHFSPSNMPGAYAHITLVNLAKEPERLEAASVPVAAVDAIRSHFRCCELGALSPDYPYLQLRSAQSKRWADLFHCEQTGEPIRLGIRLARTMQSEQQAALVAWLMGYAAHIVADLTIHPVIEMRVSASAFNAMAHRRCELHQDAYIFQRLHPDESARARHLGSGVLDRTIINSWHRILSECHPEEYRRNRPDIDAWHSGFKWAVDAAETGSRMPRLARSVAVNCGLAYPTIDSIDASFIRKLDTPDGRMDYDELFDKALANIGAMWRAIGQAVFEDCVVREAVIGDWNLNTGMNERGMYAFWPNQPPRPAFHRPAEAPAVSAGLA
nr:zinc dependent phospholipase C family protein [Massilia terrae]